MQDALITIYIHCKQRFILAAQLESDGFAGGIAILRGQLEHTPIAYFQGCPVWAGHAGRAIIDIPNGERNRFVGGPSRVAHRFKLKR